jgi:hypothetical protein
MPHETTRLSSTLFNAALMCLLALMQYSLRHL